MQITPGIRRTQHCRPTIKKTARFETAGKDAIEKGRTQEKGVHHACERHHPGASRAGTAGRHEGRPHLGKVLSPAGIPPPLAAKLHMDLKTAPVSLTRAHHKEAIMPWGKIIVALLTVAITVIENYDSED